jgi:PAS domain S-box-containing protein
LNSIEFNRLFDSPKSLRGDNVSEGNDEQILNAVSQQLAVRLTTEARTSEIVHLVLVPVIGLAVWQVLSPVAIVIWLGSVTILTLFRTVTRLRLKTRSASPREVINSMRFSVLVSGLGWGIGIAIMGHQLPLENLLLVLVVFAGLIAGGSATLIADPRSFTWLEITLLVPLVIGVLTNGTSILHLLAIFLILFFGATMAAINKRSHRRAVSHLERAHELGTIRAQLTLRSTALESAANAIVLTDQDGTIEWVNPAFTSLTGYTFEEILGENPRLLKSGIQNQAMYDELWRTISGGDVWKGELINRHKNGRLYTEEMTITPVLSTAGTVTHFIAIKEDISDRKAAEEELLLAHDAAKAASRAKGAFLANMSHEIRTPLNGILGMTELILDTELTSDQRESLEIIQESSNALLRVINDILDYSKIEAGQFTIEKIPFDLHLTLESTIRPFVVKAFQQNVEVVLDLSPDLTRNVTGDPGRLRQVLNNLIGNAVKFTHEGEILLTAGVEDAADDQVLVTISVKDTGIGIPPEKMEQIFEKFTQADTSTTREYGGTGLGLAISQSIVKLMGGELQVESEAGKGSDFSFTIPLKIAEQIEGTEETDEAPDRSISLKDVRGIVIDDNSTNRRIVREILKAEQIVSDEAADAESGLEMIRKAASDGIPYQLAVIDVHMPGMDGFELASQIGDDPELKDLSLMMLTSGSQKGDGERCRQLGISAYLPKPVSRPDFLQATISLLTGSSRTSGKLITRHTIDEARIQRKILIAEDNPVNQKVAATMLTKRGHEVEVVNNGREAVEAVLMGRFDVVLMDIQMPEMDGTEATAEIRNHPDFRNLPIIALTAHAMEGDADKYLAAGMTGYLSKPFKPHELFAAVEGWGVASDTG